MDFSTRNCFYAWGQPLAGRIDGIRTHRISHIVNEMHHEERPDGRGVEHSNLEITGPAAELFQDGVDGIRLCQQGGFLFVQFELCLCQVRDVNDLHLADHERIGGRGAESAAGAGQFCHERRAGHHRRLLERHGDEHIPPVDPEIQGNPQRQAVQADHIFDHVVGGFRRESACGKRKQVFGSQMRSVRQLGTSFIESHIVEARDA